MNIVILSQPRTGSNLLSRVLGNFSPFRELNEFFMSEIDAEKIDRSILPYNVFLGRSEFLFLKFLLKTDTENFLKSVHSDIDHTLKSLDEIIKHTKIFKIQDHQLTEDQLEQLLNNPTLKFIVLERKDKLKQYTSVLVTNQVKQFFRVDTSSTRINIDSQSFIDFKNRTESWYTDLKQKLKNKNINFLDLVYEDDLEFIDESKLFEKIKIWLDQEQIHYSEYTSRDLYYFKQNKTPIEETVLNYKELN
jgi:LPS sulfotransferase NodH